MCPKSTGGVHIIPHSMQSMMVIVHSRLLNDKFKYTSTYPTGRVTTM